jgi:hypothetical protein
MHEHLNLNFGNSGPRQASTSGLLSPPQTQQQQQQQQQHRQHHHQLQQQQQPPPPANPAALNLAQPRPDAPANPAPNPSGGAPVAAPERAAAGNGAQPLAPDAPVVPPPDAQVIERQAAELIALRTRVQQLEAGQRDALPHADAAPARAPIPPVLFAAQDAIDRAKAAAAVARDSDKKPSLPDIIPGFKANSLDVREC